MKIVKRIMLGLFILSLIGLYVVIYAVPGVTGAFTKTEILEYGNLKIMDSEICYIIRNEKVYTASRGGVINYYIGDAVLVKTGTKILNAGNADYTSEFNGVTSYYIDGYENYFTPDTMRELKYDVVSSIEAIPANVVKNETLTDEPLFKICDNREWFLICWVDARNIAKYERKKSVVIELPLGQVKATIEDIIEDDGKWLIIFRSDRYYEDFARIRTAPATIVIADYNGILIRNESIAVKDGAIGVYVKTKSGDFIFKRIKVIATDGESVLAEVSYYYNDEGERVGTVNIYDEILTNPK